MAIAGGSYAGAYGATVDPRVVATVTMALMNQAVSVYTEAGTTPGHAARAAFATKVLTGQANLTALIQAICAQGVTTSSTDAAIDTAVDSLWSALAGA
jgi:hypothetical protein